MSLDILIVAPSAAGLYQDRDWGNPNSIED